MATKRTAAQILAHNLDALMGSGESRLPQHFLVSKGVPQSRIAAALGGNRRVRIDLLDALAAYFDLHPWQLLVPDLDPKERPLLRRPRGVEAEFYDKLREMAREMGLDREPT